MLAYNLRIAWKSVKRTPVLSILLVSGIALGIAVSTAFVTTYYVIARDPIPEKSQQLFHVQIDSWDPEGPYDDDEPNEPPDQLTFRDVDYLLTSDIPTAQSGMFAADLTVHPANEEQRPFRAQTRVCNNDFFQMFQVPFQHGSGWDDGSERRQEAVVVLSHETNLKLFGGENSVGESVRIEDRDFTVAGVTAPWQPSTKFYDLTQGGGFGQGEELFVPFSLVRPMELPTAGNTNGWKFQPGDTFEDFLQSELTWLQMWVELDQPEQRERYLAHLDAYVLEQQKLGRLERPLNNRLRTVTEWLTSEEAVPDEARTLVVIGFLFLIVCSMNLIGMLLGKFLARAPEVGVRRALGASRRSVFAQHLIECELIGLLGGVLGLGLSHVALIGLNRLFGEFITKFSLDGNMVLVGIFLSLVAGLVAGLYPSWRICRVQPALYLKAQ